MRSACWSTKSPRTWGGSQITASTITRPLSLFRYTSDGSLATTGNESAYFSIDGGNTNLDAFNNASNGGDAGDWAC